MKEIKVKHLLKKIKKTQKERERIYGKGHLVHAKVLLILFPDGVDISSKEKAARWVLFNMVFVKFLRYARNLNEGGHLDSIHDLTSYSLLLEAFDSNHQKKESK